MGKWMAQLWAGSGLDVGEWQATLRRMLPPLLLDAGATQVRLNLPDAAVAAGEGLKQSSGGALLDAFLQVWGDVGQWSDGGLLGSLLGAMLGGQCVRWAGWQVEERVVIDDGARRSAVGERSEGWAQMAVLRRPPDMAYADWLEAWQGRHTAVAVETQSTFGYVQNRVTGHWPGAADDIVAIVEECFPMAALTDPLVFFAAEGEPDRFRANLARMMESCHRFIVPGTIDVMPTSQYEWAASYYSRND